MEQFQEEGLKIIKKDQMNCVRVQDFSLFLTSFWGGARERVS